MISFRAMTVEDIPAGLGLCRAAGWNQRREDWELFLALSPGACQVAIDPAGKIAGTVTTVSYQDHFSWIGMLLVDPAWRRRGIGMKLLRASTDILRGAGTIKLDATEQGRQVYLKMNFVDEYPLSRMVANKATPKRLLPSRARRLVSDDFESLLTFDREIFGADRGKVLEWSWKNAPQFAFLTEDTTGISGYCLGRPGHHYTHIGPIVARDVQQAMDLISDVMRQCDEQAILLDISLHDPAWGKWISSIGFVEQRRFIRMYHGSNAWPGRPEKQFAILGPELG